MNDKNSKPDLPQQIETLLRNVQDKLSTGVWPEKADRLLNEITSSDLDSGTYGDEFLSIVINDALEGVDISQKYPAFFQRLLHDPRLQEAFQDGLVQLADDDLDAPQPAFIEAGSLPAGLLDSAAPSRSQRGLVDGWIAAWSLTSETLQALVNALWGSSSVAYRSAGASLDRSRVTLLRREVAPGGDIEVLLEASYEPQSPERVLLSLWIATDDELQTPPELIAELQWGRYVQEFYLQEWGKIPLPPITVEEIITADGQLKATSLYLRIATIS